MKKTDYIFRIIKIVFTIINVLIIISFGFVFIGDFSWIVNLLLITGLILLYKFQNKLIDRIGKIKLLLIYALPTILITIFIVSVSILIKVERVAEWNKIKEDYEIINNIAIKYDEHTSLYFGENYTSLIDYDFSKKDENGNYEKTIIDLNEEEKNALKNIANFYSGQEGICIREYDIDYTDNGAVGTCIVKYVKNKRKVDLKGFKHLTGNWYYFRVR